MNLLKALGQAVIDLFRIRILLLFLIPPVIALLFWTGLAYFFWSPLLGLSQAFSDKFLAVQQIPGWMIDWFSITPALVATAIAGIVAILMVVPLGVVTALILTQVFVMPVVLNVIGKEYPQIPRLNAGLLPSISNTIKACFAYVVLWIVSLPLWMVPGLGVAVPLLLNGFLNYRLFTFDVLLEFARPDERKILMSQKRLDLFLLGVIISAMMVFPLMFLVVPVYGALAFTRLCLAELQLLRFPSQNH